MFPDLSIPAPHERLRHDYLVEGNALKPEDQDYGPIGGLLCILLALILLLII